jgi:hypothetical protein
MPDSYLETAWWRLPIREARVLVDAFSGESLKSTTRAEDRSSLLLTRNPVFPYFSRFSGSGWWMFTVAQKMIFLKLNCRADSFKNQPFVT